MIGKSFCVVLRRFVSFKDRRAICSDFAQTQRLEGVSFKDRRAILRKSPEIDLRIDVRLSDIDVRFCRFGV